MLYVRMLFSMLVSLYTSRVVLQVLGVEDYGIYNIVGGVVAMMGFLNASMSGATSRFLTFEIGKGDIISIRNTFSTALIIHIGIAILIFVLAESIGIWFLEHKLVIPIERMNSARIIYQFSIVSTLLGITQVPYNSCIIAHEEMNVYAYVEILNVCLKLIIVWILSFVSYDKLIIYGMLTLIISIIIMLIYRWYCIHNYKESHFQFIWINSKLKSMLSFSVWDLYGNASVMLRQQGVNMILNMFIGPMVNAAGGIATTVNSVITSFISNIVTAVRPQIIKNYAIGELDRMFSLMIWAVKICLSLFLVLIIPLLFEMSFVLHLWLGNVPLYAVNFCKIMLITSCFTAITSIINIGIHATGRVFLISFISGTIIWLAVPIIYLFLKSGFQPNIAYICNGIVSFIVAFVNMLILKYNIRSFPVFRFIKKGLIPSICLGFTIGITIFYMHLIINNEWMRLFLSCLISISEGGAYIFLFPS